MASSTRWWTEDTVAVVTGSNKGIGFEIVKKLAEEGLTVVLTARDDIKGSAAAQKLKFKGLNVHFHPLDVLSAESISKLASWLKQKYEGLDILINNAAITDYEASYTCAQMVLETNYKSLKAVTRELLPLFKASLAGARIVNISSGYGKLERLANSALRDEIGNIDNLTEEKIDRFVEKYLEDVKEQRLEIVGWPSRTYSVSKIVLNAYTRTLARSLEDQPDRHFIYVNCVSPGYCKTDMTGNQGFYTAEQGAETPVWVALLPPQGPTGQFFAKKNVECF